MNVCNRMDPTRVAAPVEKNVPEYNHRPTVFFEIQLHATRLLLIVRL
jgi:hypothetical protein